MISKEHSRKYGLWMCSEGSQATLGVHHLGGWTILSSHSQRPDAHGSLFIVFSSCASSLKSLFQTLNQSAQLSILWQSYLFTCKNTFWPKMCVAWIHYELQLTLLTFKYLTGEVGRTECSTGPSFSRGMFLACIKIVFKDQRKHEKYFSKQTNETNSD